MKHSLALRVENELEEPGWKLRRPGRELHPEGPVREWRRWGREGKWAGFEERWWQPRIKELAFGDPVGVELRTSFGRRTVLSSLPVLLSPRGDVETGLTLRSHRSFTG